MSLPFNFCTICPRQVNVDAQVLAPPELKSDYMSMICGIAITIFAIYYDPKMFSAACCVSMAYEEAAIYNSWDNKFLLMQTDTPHTPVDTCCTSNANIPFGCVSTLPSQIILAITDNKPKDLNIRTELVALVALLSWVSHLEHNNCNLCRALRTLNIVIVGISFGAGIIHAYDAKPTLP